MQQIDLPSKEQWTDLVVRPTFSLLEAADRVGPIVEAVKHNGDAALLNFTKQFDGAELDSLAVERAVLNAAQVSTPPSSAGAVLTSGAVTTGSGVGASRPSVISAIGRLLISPLH